MQDTQIKSEMHEDSAKIMCNPKATFILIDIFRSHTKSKFTLILNAGEDGDSSYDEFQFDRRNDGVNEAIVSCHRELMSRLCSRESSN
jgi:hypothetical protein